MTKTVSRNERRDGRQSESETSPGLAGRLAAGGRRGWPLAAAVIAAVLWWPVGFKGTADWLHLPLRILDGDVVFLGALAGATAVAALVRGPWPRVLIVAGLSGLGWLLSAPGRETAPDERQVLAVILLAGALLGMFIGARAWRGPMALAGVLAVLAGTTPAGWDGVLLAVALALPIVLATKDRVAPTIFGVLRVLVTWLGFSVLALALRYGWDVLRPGAAGGPSEQARQVGDAAWDFLRTQWWTASEALLRSHTVWFWVALALAMLIATARAMRAMESRETAHS